MDDCQTWFIIQGGNLVILLITTRSNFMPPSLGFVILFGSGETSPSGQKIHDWLFRQLPAPPQIAILETPAGFEPNSAEVAGQTAVFLQKRLQNYHPATAVIPARKRHTAFSPDDPLILEPLWQANAIYLGAGSPTYTVRQLQGSLAWQMLTARHRLGTAVVLASAATLAASRYTLPVYEIYKVGEDLHWQDGLDFFGAYGLNLVFIPHWNNNDGGASLDTSHCFVGQARFEALLPLLPSPVTFVGLDEHTAVVFDLNTATCQVMGRGGVTILGEGATAVYTHGQPFPMSDLGPFQQPQPSDGLAADLWQMAQTRHNQPLTEAPAIPTAVQALADERQAARVRRDWAAADHFRAQVKALGWQIVDTPNGCQLEPLA